jgi:hypothetical protein
MTGGHLWWALLVLPLWVVLILCTHGEPVMGDGWGHLWWHREHTLGWHEIYDFCKEIYLYENPRLGQLLTMLAYTPGPYHVIITPLVEIAVFATLTVLALGRWPDVRRSGDALVAAIITATIASCAPQIGLMLFYRPFTGNYTFGLALNLWWLVPYRLELVAARPARLWLAPLMLVLGLAAGLSNEHTGLAFLAMGLLASLVALRRRGLRIWMIAGLVGLFAGYWLLLTAPGQHLRYQGLAEHAGILERITDRGGAGNLRVVGLLILALVPVLPLVGIAMVERRATGPSALSARDRWACIVLALGGLACTLTLLASPKIGPRLYLASIALIAAGLAGWIAAQLRRAWARRSCAILAAGALVFVAVRLITIHRVIGPLGAIRRDRIEHGAPGSVVTVPRSPYDRSRYFFGDDLIDPVRRKSLASAYGLQAIELEAAADP